MASSDLLDAKVWMAAAAVVLVIWLGMVGLFSIAERATGPQVELSSRALDLVTAPRG